MFDFDLWPWSERCLSRFRRDKRATTPLEYAIIATITVMICITAFVRTGAGGNVVMSQLAATLISTQNGIPSPPPSDPGNMQAQAAGTEAAQAAAVQTK